MNDCGLASTTGSPASRPSTTSAPRLVRLEPARRSARRAGPATRKPALCRVAGVARARVAEPDDQIALVGHRRSTAVVGAAGYSRRCGVAGRLGARPRPARPSTPAPRRRPARPRSASAVGASWMISSTCSGSPASVEPARQREVAGRDLRADLEPGDARPRSRSGRCVASASTLTEVLSCAAGRRARCRRRRERHVDGDLLAAAHGQQVDVLVDALDRVALDRLRDGQLLAAFELEGEQHVGAAVADGVGELAGRQRHVARIGAVAVDDGGDLAGAAGAAGATLAELGARLGVQTDLGHSGTPELSGRLDSRCLGRWSTAAALHKT